MVVSQVAEEPHAEDVKGREADAKINHLVAKQLKKTKMCAMMGRGPCKDAGCRFAHSWAELRTPPDLTKTAMCILFSKGECHNDACRFAHGVKELRYTAPVYKTQLCNFFEKGHCKKGNKCRHAHGAQELRRFLEDPKDEEFLGDQILGEKEPGGKELPPFLMPVRKPSKVAIVEAPAAVEHLTTALPQTPPAGGQILQMGSTKMGVPVPATGTPSKASQGKPPQALPESPLMGPIASVRTTRNGFHLADGGGLFATEPSDTRAFSATFGEDPVKVELPHVAPLPLNMADINGKQRQHQQQRQQQQQKQKQKQQ